jgi:hypothetical protein
MVDPHGGLWWTRAAVTDGRAMPQRRPRLAPGQMPSLQDGGCSCTQSILISDGHNNSITSILNSVFDSPIVITSARVVRLVADEVGSTWFTVSAGTLLMSSTYASTSTTISGAGGARAERNGRFCTALRLLKHRHNDGEHNQISKSKKSGPARES